MEITSSLEAFVYGVDCLAGYPFAFRTWFSAWSFEFCVESCSVFSLSYFSLLFCFFPSSMRGTFYICMKEVICWRERERIIWYGLYGDYLFHASLALRRWMTNGISEWGCGSCPGCLGGGCSFEIRFLNKWRFRDGSWAGWLVEFI